jgi:hypothetical protein
MEDLFATHLASNRRVAESFSLGWRAGNDCRSLLPLRLRWNSEGIADRSPCSLMDNHLPPEEEIAGVVPPVMLPYPISICAPYPRSPGWLLPMTSRQMWLSSKRWESGNRVASHLGERVHVCLIEAPICDGSGSDGQSARVVSGSGIKIHCRRLRIGSDPISGIHMSLPWERKRTSCAHGMRHSPTKVVSCLGDGGCL